MSSIEKRIVGKRYWLALAAIVALTLATGLSAVLLANAPVRAAGTDWYVNATTGNDTYDGSSPTWPGSGTVGPKKTITAMLGDPSVTSGDTVNVAAGEYDEYFHISKSIVLSGTSGPSTTIIKGGDPYSVYIETTGVTFTGFTVENPDYDGGSDASGIVVQPPWGTPSNIHVYNNVIHDIGKHTSPSVTYGRVGINICFPYGAVEVDHNEIYNIWHSDSTHDVWANGICIWGSDPSHPATDVNVHDNYIHDIDCPKPRAAGISLQPDVDSITLSNNRIANTKDYGIELRGGSHNPTVVRDNSIDGSGTNGINYGVRCSDPYPANVTGNTITACNTGVWATDPESIWSQPPATTPLVQLNKIYGNHSYGMDNLLSGVATATKNWWGTAYKPTIKSKISTGVNVTFEPYYVDASMTKLNLPLPTPVYIDLSYTDGSAGTHIFGYDAFNKLQEGIDGVAAYGTVNVAAGTYTEWLQPIYKHVTVTGADKSTTIINGGDPYSVQIYATDVSFSGFTVMNPNCTSGSDVSGIVIEPPAGSPSNIHVHDNIVRDIGNPNTPCTSYSRVGINIGGPFDGPVEVDHNEVYNIKHNGSVGVVWAEGIGIWGNGPSQPANNVDVHDNYIHDVYCPEPKAAGIWTMADVKGLKIRNNRIENTKDLGIDNWGGSQDSTLIEGNQITGSGSQGIATGIRCSDPFAADVTGNTITACNVGVRVQEHDPDPTWGGPSATVQPNVRLNRIAGNTAAGLSNELPFGTTPATKNWWGSVYGPWSSSHTGGDKVSGLATTNPWCTNSTLTEICSFPLHVKNLMTAGIFAIPVAAAETSTPHIKAADRVVINVSLGSATHTITLPTDTMLAKASGSSINTGDLLATYVTPGTLSGFQPGTIVRAGLQWGIPGQTMNFSKPITIRLYTGPGLEGRRLNVYRSITGSSGWTSDGIATVAPRVSGGYVTFQATKASYYAAVSPPRKATGSSFYFAEGYTGAGFDEYLSLGNPNSSGAKVNVTYMFSDGTTKAASYNVPPQSRYTVNVNSEVGPGREVSLLVQSTTPNLVAERPMYFNYTNNGTVNWTGGHDVIGATAPGLNWYFAEGYTGPGFDEYVCVLNPGDTAAALTFRFQTQESGEKAKTGYSVPAHSRSTFKVNDILGSNYQSSLKLESDRPVVAERPMYFDYKGIGSRDWSGGSCVMGAPALTKQYYFAEGTTRNVPSNGEFEEWLTLQNTNAGPITIDATYQLGEGQGENVTRSYIVKAGTRQTVYVPSEVGENKDVSVLLTCGSDFLAERPMYFNYGGAWTGGDCVIGSTSTGTRWFFAEGYTGQNFQEWLTLQNPGTQDSSVEITYFTLEARAKGPYQVNVPAGTRYTVNVNEQAGAGLQLSAQIVSSKPVVAERPMYFNYNDAWTGGHDVVGYPF